MNRTGRILATLAGLAGGAAWADDLGTVTLFGQEYRLQRFLYSEEVFWEDQASCGNPPGTLIYLVEAEGTHYVGNNKLYFATNELDAQLTYDNQVIEVNLDTDAQGHVTGLSFSRVVVANDRDIPNQPDCTTGENYSIHPRGVTVNQGSTGIGANGGVIIVSNNEEAFAYDPATGQPYPPPFRFSLLPHNGNSEDIAFVPSAPLPGGGTQDMFYTVDQGSDRVVRFSTSGAFIDFFPIGGGVNPQVGLAEAKGLTYLPDVPTFPAPFRGRGGVVLVVYDETGPGLHAFTLSGQEIAYEPLVADGVPLFDIDGNPDLQLESGANDPATGRLFFTLQNSSFVDDFFFVLTPTGGPTGCPQPGCDSGGLDVDFDDDCAITIADLTYFLSNFGLDPCPPDMDINRDGLCDGNLSGLTNLLSRFGNDCR